MGLLIGTMDYSVSKELILDRGLTMVRVKFAVLKKRAPHGTDVSPLFRTLVCLCSFHPLE